MDRPKSFFACDSSAPVRVEHEGGTAAWLPGTLVVTSVQDTGCLRLRSNSLIRVFFRASCCWPSEGLFSQSFSIAPSIQALRRLPCLGAFSDVWQVRHIEGVPLAGVLLCSSVPQAFDGPASLFFSCRCCHVGRQRLW